MLKLLFCFALAAGAWQLFFSTPSAISLSAGVKVAEAPRQSKIADKKRAATYLFEGHQITPLANFSIQAKVLAREDYSFDRGAELSPVDLALGWQNMSDQRIVDQIKISQSNRWYRWRVSDFPIPRKHIETQSANMHLIPRDGTVRRQLDKIRVGQIIQLEGQLVDINGNDGFKWKSSLTRDDVGANACELIMVDSISLINAS